MGKIKFPLVSDEAQEISSAFGVADRGCSKRSYVLIDPSAQIRFIWICDSSSGCELDVFECLNNLQIFQNADEKVHRWSVDYEGHLQEEPEEENELGMLLFHLKKVSDSKPEEIVVTDYLEIFEDLQKFLKLVGLNRLARDTKLRTKDVQDLRQTKGLLYKTINSVLIFEKLTETSVSTCNLLHLNRTLEFAAEFLFELEFCFGSNRMGKAAKKAYRRTLMRQDSCCSQTINLMEMLNLKRKSKLIENLVPESSRNPMPFFVWCDVCQDLKKTRNMIKIVEEKVSQVFQKNGFKP